MLHAGKISRSVISVRSRPALKWSPAPASTTARTSLGERAKNSLDAAYHRIVERIALGGTIEPQYRDWAMALRLQGRRQVGEFGW